MLRKYKIVYVCNGDNVLKLENLLNEGWDIGKTDIAHDHVYYILVKFI